MAQHSNSGHQLLLPPADWCPVFAVWTTQGYKPEVKDETDTSNFEQVRSAVPLSPNTLAMLFQSEPACCARIACRVRRCPRMPFL